MSLGDMQPTEPRSRRRGQEQRQSARQSNSPRRSMQSNGATASQGNAPRGEHRVPKSKAFTVSTPTTGNEIGLASSGTTEGNSLETQRSSVEAASRDISRMLFLAGSSAAVAQSPIIRYTAEELLALRESSLIRLPLDFSPYTPLRPGSQVKLPEITQATIDAKLSLGNPYIGLEHIPRTQKDIVLAPQRSANLAHRGQNASQRVFGVPRNNGVNSNQVVAMFDGGVVPEGRNAGGGYASKGSSTSSIGTRGSAGRSGNNAAGGGQSTNRQHNGHDNSRSGVVSWRASGPTRTPGGSISMAAAAAAAPAAATLSNNHGHLGEIAEGGKPEWMDDDLVYDENKSARQMHDMEEWKRRMKEGGGTNGSALQLGGNNPNAIDMSSGLAADQIDQSSAGGDKGAVRGSRFLRLFSANEQQADHAAADLSGSTLPVPGGLLHDVMAASAYANGLAYPNDSLQQPQQQSGDQLSKLFKVFGNKVSLGGNANANVPVPGPAAAASANGWAAHESQNAALAMHNAQALNSMHAVESMRMAMLMQAAANDTSVMGQHIEAVAQQSAAISAAPAPLGLAPMSSAAQPRVYRRQWRQRHRWPASACGHPAQHRSTRRCAASCHIGVPQERPGRRSFGWLQAPRKHAGVARSNPSAQSAVVARGAVAWWRFARERPSQRRRTGGQRVVAGRARRGRVAGARIPGAGHQGAAGGQPVGVVTVSAAVCRCAQRG
ncbi:hypothetical protein BX661DRAFT_91682 [Kickxella alabastrina]|uniref:uncharacterized protein n=1 Tax=Kickxella alabastrina TaxID=61397 RepID=UPI00221FFC37|nr:uncharacterized protein BX661DRAFT_91682 [Kickxella alabastrina]KAI7830996.1 hypothetical protein BX661DRAFT_91682 [Kickxella alabastrina]